MAGARLPDSVEAVPGRGRKLSPFSDSMPSSEEEERGGSSRSWLRCGLRASPVVQSRIAGGGGHEGWGMMRGCGHSSTPETFSPHRGFRGAGIDGFAGLDGIDAQLRATGSNFTGATRAKTDVRDI